MWRTRSVPPAAAGAAAAPCGSGAGATLLTRPADASRLPACPRLPGPACQVGNREVLIDQTDPKQAVYIYNCSGSTIQVGHTAHGAQRRQHCLPNSHTHLTHPAPPTHPPTATRLTQVRGKVNAITLDKCSRTGLLFDAGVGWGWEGTRGGDTWPAGRTRRGRAVPPAGITAPAAHRPCPPPPPCPAPTLQRLLPPATVVATCELVNSANVEVQCTGAVPTVAVDKCDGCQVCMCGSCLLPLPLCSLSAAAALSPRACFHRIPAYHTARPAPCCTAVPAARRAGGRHRHHHRQILRGQRHRAGRQRWVGELRVRRDGGARA